MKAKILEHLNELLPAGANSLTSSRRRFIVRALGGSAATAVWAGISPGLRMAFAQEAATDVDVLTYALNLERLGLAFYNEGLGRFNRSAFNRFNRFNAAVNTLGRQNTAASGNDGSDDTQNTTPTTSAGANTTSNSNTNTNNTTIDNGGNNHRHHGGNGNNGNGRNRNNGNSNTNNSSGTVLSALRNNSPAAPGTNDTSVINPNNTFASPGTGTNTVDNNTTGNGNGTGNGRGNGNGGNGNNNNGNTTTGLDAYSLITRIRDNEATHVQLLSSALQSAGGTLPTERTYNFQITDLNSFLRLAQALENTDAQVYDGAVGLLQNRSLQQQAAQIATVEARQAAFLNLLNGDHPFPVPVEPIKTLADVQAVLDQLTV